MRKKKTIKEEVKITPDNSKKEEKSENKIEEKKEVIINTSTSSSKNIEKEKEKEKIKTIPTPKPLEQSKINNVNEDKESENEEEEEENVDDDDDDDNDIEIDYESEEEIGEEQIIIKDSEFDNYVKKLYSVFILWSLSIDVSIPFNYISLDRSTIKNVNTIEILFLLNKQLKNKKLIINFLNSLNKLTQNPDNCYQLFFNIKIYSSFLDIAFENYKIKAKEEETCCNLTKNILTNTFINSFLFCEKQQTHNPGKDLETIFIWGNKVLEEDKTKKDLLFEFISELLLEFLTQFKIKYEPKIIFDSKENSYNVEKNYYFRNYLYFINIIYIFSFRFALDRDIHKKGISYLYSNSPRINIPQALIDSMRINESMNKNKIAQSWLDFPLLYDILYKIKHIWAKRNVFKDIDTNKFKKNKVQKYQYIIDNIIINKEKKNLYQKELVFLCFEDKKGGYEYLNPLIKIVPLTLICIISKLRNIDEDKDFRYWLKEFKNFIRFCIIASSNLTKINQLELYTSIEEKCLEVISAGLCFLSNLLFSISICKEKIEKTLDSLLLLCLKLVKYQFNYKLKHSGIFYIASKPARNDLQECAVCRLFNDYIKDKMGNPIMSLNKLENMPLENNNFASAISNLLIKPEFISGFWENENLKTKLNNSFYSLNSYKNLVKYRYDLIQCLQDIFDDSYKKTILILLPQYENELAKYSNNSLEKNIKNKNRYKVFKKNAFSWRGYWSLRDDFFKNISKFKIKLINHYTKTFMKPILVPILDISYYLPEFSGFKKKDLFLSL